MLTTGSVTTSTPLQWANNLVSSWHHLIDHNVKKFSYNKHLGTTSTFLCKKVLVVSGTQCNSPSKDDCLCILFWCKYVQLIIRHFFQIFSVDVRLVREHSSISWDMGVLHCVRTDTTCLHLRPYLPPQKATQITQERVVSLVVIF